MMKIKRLATILLSVLATASLATGVAVTAMANEGTNTKTPVSVTTTEPENKGNKAYYVNKEDSLAEYGQDNNSTKTGIKATMVLDDTLTICNVIDLQDMYEKDQAFIEITPIVEEPGKAEYKRITLEVIDVYDPSNFLKVQISATPQAEDTATTAYFLSCASNGQKLTGYETGSKKLHVNNEYGEWSVFSFGDVINASSGTGLFYDVDKNAISAVDYRGVKKQIIDFDDPAYFGTYLWSGFTTGEVYCRVSCSEYIKDKASVLITKYGEYDLSNDEIYDVVAPALTVDYGEYTKENIPEALTNTKYPIFPVSTFDAVDGALETDVQVYMNYYSSQKMSVSVKSGAFTPKIPTPHYIVYSAIDAHGNTTEEIVVVNVLASSDDLTLNFEEYPLSTVEGDVYTIPAYTVSGSMGNAEVDITVTVNDETLEIVYGNVRPHAEGEMKISYKAQDYVGRTYETEQTISVTEAEKPTFIELPILPKYLIAGNEYTLPALNAYDYVTSTGTAIDTVVSVVENGAEKSLVDNRYVPGEVEQAEIIYKATIGNATNEYRKSIPVYNVRNDGALDMSKYFLFGENGSAIANPNSVDLTMTADEQFEYLNYVTGLSFKTEFTLSDTSKNVSKIHIVLSDIVDETKALKFTYTFGSSTSTFYINDNVDGAVEVGGTIEEDKRYSLNLDATANKVYYDIRNNNILPVYTYLNGETFTGFTNDRVYVTFAFEGVASEATFCINSINSNYFNNETADWLAPLIDLKGNVGGEYVINDVMTLPTVIANDVLAGDVDAYITMTSPSGAILKTIDGKTLDNIRYDGTELQVKLTEYGRYLMRVTAKDMSGNEAFVNAVVWVVDTEDPEISVSDALVTTAKVGDKVKVPKASAIDNLAENMTVKIYVITAGGAMLALGENDTGFVADRAGVYTVVYYVSDVEGNFASEYYTVKVSE